MTNLRLPSISGTDKEQLAQIRSYLYQLIPELQFALNSTGEGSTRYTVEVTNRSVGSAQTNAPSFDATVAFAQLKPLIIKSADIVQAYYEKINTVLSGEYVAQSDFGTFTEQTEQRIEETSEGITQNFTNIQQIFTDIDNLDKSLVEVNAIIKHGKINEKDGVPIYGIEIGQTDPEGNFLKYAQFTSDRLAFFDNNGIELAYFSDYKLYIRGIEVTERMQEGGYVDYVQPNGGIITKWVGV